MGIQLLKNVKAFFESLTSKLGAFAQGASYAIHR